MLNRKAQTQIISAILITGIVLGVVSVSYLWGVPLIQKSQTNTQITIAENLMTNIQKAIDDVVQTGTQKSILVNLDGKLEVSEDQNSIFYTITTKGLGIMAGDWIPLNDQNMFGIQGTTENQSVGVVGVNKAGVIIAKSIVAGDQYQTIFRLAYRELDDMETKEGHLVQIKEVGNNIATGGQKNLIIKREDILQSETPSKSGGKLLITTVSVTIA